MRKLIAGMKVSADEKFGGPDGYADWVDGWSEIQSAPDKPLPMTSKLPISLGGGRTTSSLIDAGLVDELRLIVYPLIAGEGKALFAATERRRGLTLRKAAQLDDGRVSLIYGIG